MMLYDVRAFPPPASDRNAQPRRRAPDRRVSPRRAAGRGPSGQPICTRAGRARREPPHRARHHPAAARRPKGQLPDRMLREPDAGVPRPRAAEHPALHAAHGLCTRLATRAILTHRARTVSHPTATHPTATPHADAAALARVSSTCPATCQSSSTAPWSLDRSGRAGFLSRKVRVRVRVGVRVRVEAARSCGSCGPTNEPNSNPHPNPHPHPNPNPNTLTRSPTTAGVEAARWCGLNLISTISDRLGDTDKGRVRLRDAVRVQPQP